MALEESRETGSAGEPKALCFEEQRTGRIVKGHVGHFFSPSPAANLAG